MREMGKKEEMSYEENKIIGNINLERRPIFNVKIDANENGGYERYTIKKIILLAFKRISIM